MVNGKASSARKSEAGQWVLECLLRDKEGFYVMEKR